MDEFKIQSLIAQNKVATLDKIDPDNTYIQVGIYQRGNQKRRSGNANVYPPAAMALSEIINTTSSTTGVVVLNAVVNLSNPLATLVFLPSSGLFVVEGALVGNADRDLSGFGNMFLGLKKPGASAPSLTTKVDTIPQTDLLNNLFVAGNYVNMIPNADPTCLPPPCNGDYILDGSVSQPLQLSVTTPSLIDVNVTVYIKLLKIF